MSKVKNKQYPNPEFGSIKEEDEYWKTHSALDEGFEGEIQPSQQKRSSFLSVRLSGEELTELRDMAVEAGVGTSTLARSIIKNAISRKNFSFQHHFSFPLDEGSKDSGLTKVIWSTTCPKGTKDKGFYILNADEMMVDEDSFRMWLELMCRLFKYKEIRPEDADFKKVEELIK